MIITLRQRMRLSPRGEPSVSPPALPQGRRAYAIGDVHGRLDLLAPLVEALEADDRARGESATTFVLLGDLVDRGPASAAVVAFALEWRERYDVRLVAANHEEMFLAALADVDAFRQFLRIGGRETILSYGVDPAALDGASYREGQALACAAVPAAHRAWLAAAEPAIRIGDYAFTHAGIRPGIALESQRGEDLRWIREPFLTSEDDHGCVIVHGHTITGEPEVRRNRIGIDTGAYRSGRLTALGLEGTRRWLIEARGGVPGSEGTGASVVTSQRSL